MGSRSNILAREDTIIFSTLPLDSDMKADKLCLIGLGLVTGMGDDDCKSDWILIIFSLTINVFQHVLPG